MELEGLAGEAPVDDLQLLLEDRRAGIPVHAVRGEVRGLVPDAEPEDDPAPADPIEHQHVLRQPDRVVKRCCEHGRPEADRGRPLQEACSQQHR